MLERSRAGFERLGWLDLAGPIAALFECFSVPPT